LTSLSHWKERLHAGTCGPASTGVREDGDVWVGGMCR